jgi:hypothetical protein
MNKAAAKVTLNNLYYFNKKTQQFDLTYDQITRAAKYITRANERNKTLGNKQAKTLLTSIADKIKNSKNGEIFIDHDWISTITDCQPEQNTKIMGQLADILDFKYHRSVIFEGKKRHYGLIVKFTHDGQKRLTNPELFYDVPSPKKIQKTSEVTPKKIEVMTEKNRLYIRDMEEEDKPLSYAKGGLSSYKSSILKEETNTRAHVRDPIQQNQQDKHATFAPCSLTEPEQVAYISEKLNQPSEPVTICHKFTANKENTPQSTTNCNQLQLTKEENPEMKQDDITQATDEQTRRMLLSQALWKALGTQRSGEVQDSWIFQELEPDKVGIYMGSIRFSDMEKEKVPEAIKSVYGQNVKIIGIKYGSKNKEQEHPSNEEVKAPIYPISKNKKASWLDFKAAIRITNLINMLTNPVLKIIEIPGKVIIETVPFLIERLTAPGHFDELERVVFQTGLTLELHSTNPRPEYKNFHKDPIVISPGRILEDQEFRQTCEPLVLSEILEEAKRNKEE